MTGLRKTLGHFIVIVSIIVIVHTAAPAGGTLAPGELNTLKICEGVVRRGYRA